jgi:large subunit ribosomal protein L18
MTKKVKKLYLQQKKRYLKKIVGSSEKPRLAVFRSHQHIYAQLIDDSNNCTLAASSTLTKDLQSKLTKGATQEAASLVGEHLAELANNKQITTVIFDRSKRPYHGRVKSLAEGARKGGLKF